MSGGEKKKKATRSQGWEEAGSEFYQESYPGDAEIEVLWKDPKKLATLLPSKQTRAVAATIRLRTNDTRTNRSTIRRRTMSRRGSTVNRAAGEVQVSMLPDLSEMKSNEQTAWEEIMAIKALPLCMAKKREEKDKIMSQQHLRLQGLEQFNWKRRKAWHKFQSRLVESYHKLELWGKDLKHIEGHFGTGVVSFFRFLKWLFFLNLLILLLVILFVVLPTLLLDLNKNIKCTDPMDDSRCFDKYYCSIEESNLAFEIAQGTGRLEKTPIFYGFYSNSTLGYQINGTSMYYNLPLAYIMVTLVYFLVSLFLIVRTGAKGFRERLLEGEGQFYQYSNIIFGGWDFCIHNEKSARIKHRAIYTEIKTLLETERLEEERQNRTSREKCKILFLRALVNTIVVAVLVLCGCAIYYIFDISQRQLNDLQNTGGALGSTDIKLDKLFFEFLPSMSIVALNMFVPFIFRFLISYESYGPIIELRLTLIRTVFLRLAALIVFYGSMYSKIRCSNDTLSPKQCTISDCDRPECWETFVGQQIYKLLLTDFFITLVVTFVINFCRAMLAKHIEGSFSKLIGEQTFDLPRHVLDIIYTQTLCWIGIFFAPLLCVLTSIIFFLLFYVKKFACLVNCKPSSTIYRASKSNSMFMVVLLVSYIVALIPIAFVVAELTPSVSCGPFRTLPSSWTLIEQTFLSAPLWVQSVVAFLPTAGFGIPVFIILILLLYYYAAVNSANRHMVTVLKNQLVLEGHDKKFLIDRLLMFLKQENDKRSRFARSVTDGDTLTNSSLHS